jgi:hypothetical protein
MSRRKFRIPRRPKLRYRRTLLAVYSIVRGDRTLLVVTDARSAAAYVATLNCCSLTPARIVREEVTHA